MRGGGAGIGDKSVVGWEGSGSAIVLGVGDGGELEGGGWRLPAGDWLMGYFLYSREEVQVMLAVGRRVLLKALLFSCVFFCQCVHNLG